MMASRRGAGEEHEKLAKIKKQSQVCGEFVDWLQSEEIFLASFHKYDDEYQAQWHPVNRSIVDLLAEFFGIDQAKLEAEKQQMLEEIRVILDRSVCQG